MLVNLKGIIKSTNKIEKSLKKEIPWSFYTKNTDYMKGNFKHIALKKNLQLQVYSKIK